MHMSKNDAVSADVHSTTKRGLNDAVWKATSIGTYWIVDDATEDAMDRAASRHLQNAVDMAKQHDFEHPGLRVFMREQGHLRQRQPGSLSALEPEGGHMEEAKLIVESLSTAFGGLSQVPGSLLGHAVFGRVTNGGPRTNAEIRTLIDGIVGVIAGHRNDVELDEDSLRARIVGGYRAAWNAMRNTHAPLI